MQRREIKVGKQFDGDGGVHLLGVVFLLQQNPIRPRCFLLYGANSKHRHVLQRSFNAEDAKVGAEERGGEFSLRPLRQPLRPLGLIALPPFGCGLPSAITQPPRVRRSFLTQRMRRNTGQGNDRQRNENIPLPIIPLPTGLCQPPRSLRLIGRPGGVLAAWPRYVFAPSLFNCGFPVALWLKIQQERSHDRSCRTS